MNCNVSVADAAFVFNIGVDSIALSWMKTDWCLIKSDLQASQNEEGCLFKMNYTFRLKKKKHPEIVSFLNLAISVHM